MEDLFQYLVRNKVQLTKFVSKDQRLRIVVKKELEKKGHSVLISRRICDQFERRLRLGTVVGWVKREMRGLKLVGYKVLLSGRVGGRERARAVCLRDGRVCLHTIRADVDYAVSVARTRYGSLGVKVWICRGGLGIQKG
jgi:small subunit ribosomal protein S3